MVIILDNARYHHYKGLRSLLCKHHRHITLMYLPPYSPELNPVERVWKLTRKLCTHNEYFDTLEKLAISVEKRFCIWSSPNETLRTLCATN